MIISHLCIYIYINIYIYICIIDSTSFWAHSDCYNQPQKQVFHLSRGVFYTVSDLRTCPEIQCVRHELRNLSQIHEF